MYEQIASNKRRTAFIVVVFVALLVAVGVALNWLFGGGVVGLVIALVVVGIISFVSYWNSAKVALAVSRARPADPEEYARLHNLVEGLCIASGLPKPALYIVDDPAPNAFATGRNPDNAAVAVTTGLLAIMNRVELEGVLAHELSHIKNYDTLVMTVCVTMVGAIAIVADFAAHWMFWGGARGRAQRSDNNAGGAVLALVGLVVIIVAPLAAKLLQLAVSRRREFLADASGVMMTRYPPGLISALEKLEADHTVQRTASSATEHLWIEQPVTPMNARGRRNGYDRLFSTHPPMRDRIAALREM